MRFAVGLLCVFLGVASTTAKAAAGDAASRSLDALLARVRAASGAPYRLHIVSISHETRDGRTVEITTESEGPRYRMRACSQGVCSGYYFDGERAYDSNLNDTLLPRSGPPDPVWRTIDAIATYAFVEPHFAAAGGDVRERSAVRRNGQTYRRIAIAARDGASLEATIDPATALVAAVATPDGRRTLAFADQRPVGKGVVLPFAVDLDGASYRRYERRSIADGPLEAPAGLVPTFGADVAPIAMARIDRATDQPVVPCRVGDERTTCLLDTGNSGLSMSLELAERLRLEPTGAAFTIEGIGSYATGVVRAPALVVGAATYPSAGYVVLHDLHRYGYDVVLGADAFAHARITIDAGRRSVVIASTSLASANVPPHAVAIAFERFVPTTNVRVGDVAATLALDTGDESAVNLADAFYRLHPGIFTPSGTSSVSGIGGASNEITGTLARLRLGDFEIERPPIGATKHLPATGDGHLGSGLLRHFTTTFDYGRGRIELIARPGDGAVRELEPAPTR